MRWSIFGMIAFVAIGCASNTSRPDESAMEQWRVRRPDGAPAAGAVATLLGAGESATILNGERIDYDGPSCVADADGVLRLRPISSPRLLVIVHPDGYLQTVPPRPHETSELRLLPWGCIRGKLLIGANAGASQPIRAWNENSDAEPQDPKAPSIFYELQTTTDVDGRFVFPRVPPGRIGIGRNILWHLPGGGTGAGSTQKQQLSVAPGQTLTVTLGGVGRRVAGKLLLPPELEHSQDWTGGISTLITSEAPAPLPMPREVQAESIARQQEWYDRFTQTSEGKAYLAAQSTARLEGRMYPVELQPDGHFQIQDVLPGQYQLYIDLVRAKAGESHRAGEVIASAYAELTVPPPANASLDLPVTLEAAVPHVGEQAPDFTVTTMDDVPLRLSDLRGRYVLLDFWATWCGSCLAETDSLKEVHDRFAADGKLVMISLSSDARRFEPKQYADQNGMRWPQCWIGERSEIASRYGVSGIPSIWLIGPDGTVIANHLHQDSVRQAVEKALSR